MLVDLQKKSVQIPANGAVEILIVSVILDLLAYSAATDAFFSIKRKEQN
jgi:hypothetical protein